MDARISLNASCTDGQMYIGQTDSWPFARQIALLVLVLDAGTMSPAITLRALCPLGRRESRERHIEVTRLCCAVTCGGGGFGNVCYALETLSCADRSVESS